MEFEESGIGEECGVFGCVAAGEWPTQLEVAQILTLGLVALQHRGQESAGIVTSNGSSPPTYTTLKGMGLVSTAFKPEDMLKLRYGNLGIGHTRYSTTGISELQNCQPFVVETLHGKIAVAHNGELVNAAALRKKADQYLLISLLTMQDFLGDKGVLRHGVGLSTSSDSELIMQLLCLTPPMEEVDAPDWVARIKNLMTETPTSYSLLIMHKDVIYAVRDPYGNRPLSIGRLVPISKLHSSGGEETDTEGWVVSSESCSFQSIGAKYYREVQPGEIVQISKNGIKSLNIIPRPEGDPPAFCIFEYVYFARPDSIFEGKCIIIF
ncbi:amidophosphoribosyltransferase [Silurus meridionalis]|nr:amidophosphoribosyltransferase [Silurus meridionalis]